MMTLVPEKKSYDEKMIEYFSSEEYARLSRAAKEAVCTKYLTSIIVRIKRQLVDNDDLFNVYSSERRELLNNLKYVEENGLDGAEDIQWEVNMYDGLIAGGVAIRNSIGWRIIELLPSCEALLSVDDIRSLFNVSYQDMQVIIGECGDNLMDYLLLSWWAGDTVKLFGRAMFYAMREDPKDNKILQDGLEDFMLSSGIPLHKFKVTYDRYGDVASIEKAGPVLKRIK